MTAWVSILANGNTQILHHYMCYKAQNGMILYMGWVCLKWSFGGVQQFERACTVYKASVTLFIVNPNLPMVNWGKCRDCRMFSIKFEWNFQIGLNFMAIATSSFRYFRKILYGYILLSVCWFKNYIVSSMLSKM